MDRDQTNARSEEPKHELAAEGATYATLAVRKSQRAELLQQNARRVVTALTDYAQQRDGTFVVFGSFAQGAMRFDSDLDIMIDFPAESTGDAWRFVEDVCAKLSVSADIHDARTTKPEFAARVRRTGLVLK